MQFNWLRQRERKIPDSSAQQQIQKHKLHQANRLDIDPSILSDEAGQQQSREAQDRVHEFDGKAKQGTNHIQSLSSQHSRRRSLWVVVLLLFLATVFWVFSGLNIFQQTWATALNAAFTGLSTIIAVAQWHTQRPLERSHTAVVHSGPFMQAMTSARKGAVVVYTPRTWRGTSMRLFVGLHETALPTTPLEAIATVVEDRRTGRRMFICSFPMVPPGHYTLVAAVKQRSAHITVRSGYCAEIDWR